MFILYSEVTSVCFFMVYYRNVNTYVRYGAILCDMYHSTCTSALRHECKYCGTHDEVKLCTRRQAEDSTVTSYVHNNSVFPVFGTKVMGISLCNHNGTFYCAVHEEVHLELIWT